MTNIGRLYVQIAYYSIPWKEISFEGTVIRCIKEDEFWYEELKSPTEKNPRFWKEVQQLYFSFESKNWDKIRDFYAKYGCVGTFKPSQNCREEDFDQVKYYLDWFRELTVIIRDIKAQKVGRLWELFNNGRYEMFDEHGNGFGPFYLWGDRMRLNISFAPWLRKNKDKRLFLTGPTNDEELFIAIWQAVTESVQTVFHALTSIPEPQGRTVPTSPMTTFSIHAPGALAAAFLQWFFQEVSSMNVSVCTAEDCDLPVLPPRQIYCSDRCKQRMKKRRQRSLKTV